MGGKKRGSLKLRIEKMRQQLQEIEQELLKLDMNGQEDGPSDEAGVVSHGKVKQGRGKLVAQKDERPPEMHAADMGYDAEDEGSDISAAENKEGNTPQAEMALNFYTGRRHSV